MKVKLQSAVPYMNSVVGLRVRIAIPTIVQRTVRKSNDGAVTGRLQKMLTSCENVTRYS